MIVDTLIEKIIEKQNPTCVGLDTSFSYLPDNMRAGANSLEDAAQAILMFNRGIIDAVSDIVPSVKVQIAYYEQYGTAGLRAFYETLRYAKEQGLVVITDAKRNDIGATASQYAAAFLGETNVGENTFSAFPSDFLTVNLGSTAIGTGICSEPGYAEKAVEALGRVTGWNVKLTKDWVGATSDTSCMVGYMSALKRVAVKISKICNDLRLLASGPRCGIEEINLPARQPGSSIMPGKVNPVIPEVVSQVAFKVIGNELCVTMAGEAAQMELNAMEPVMAQCCFESVDLLSNAFDTLRERCVNGITANEEHCMAEVRNSIGIVTALNPYIGYDHATNIAKKALETGRSVYDLVLEEGILTQEDLDAILDPKNMIRPVKLDIRARK